jgi:hypothetical protein
MRAPMGMLTSTRMIPADGGDCPTSEFADDVGAHLRRIQ